MMRMWLDERKRELRVFTPWNEEILNGVESHVTGRASVRRKGRNET